VTIEIESIELAEAGSRGIRYDEDVRDIDPDIVAPAFDDDDTDLDRVEIVARAHQGEDDLSTWFG